MRKRLWDKGAAPDARIHDYTVGDDPETDLHIARWDAIGSAAHAQALCRNGMLSAKETKALLVALQEILAKIACGDFCIPRELEDCHSAIEALLTEKLGETGQKIHAGRSRNDQVLVAIRLYLKSETLDLLEALEQCIGALLDRHQHDQAIAMPGYTHFQRAMPSTIGTWLHAHAESLALAHETGLALLEQIDTCPLGVGAGFGVPLDMQRTFSAGLLGFARAQRNPMHVQNSRGVHELKVLNWCKEVAHAVEKLACDLMLFTTEEFGFFALPEAYTTGSSIMPQKRNPDVVELLRGGAGKVRAAAFELEAVIAKLPSSYHRDFQLTKAPLVRGIAHMQSMLSIVPALVAGLTINADKLRHAALAPALYATFEAYRLAKNGLPFRQAYTKAAVAHREARIDPSALADEYHIIARAQEKEFAEFTAAFMAQSEKRTRMARRFAQIENTVFLLQESST